MRLIYGLTARDDMLALLTYLDEFAGTFDVYVDVDTDRLGGVISGARAEPFPHVDGLDGANVFKKAACFLVYFVGERPIRSPFQGNVLSRVQQIKNHENAVVAFQIVIDALHHATINKSDGTCVTLEKRIEVSEHSYIDIIDALAGATPITHYKMATVLLEQLAYRANPGASYPLMSSV